MSFLNFTILDLFDILLAALLLYQLYRLVRGTAAIRIFIGITAVYLMWKLVDAFHMEVLTEILGQFIGIGFLLLVIVFQQEIRRFLLMIGSATFSRRRRFLRQLLWLRKTSKEEEKEGLILFSWAQLAHIEEFRSLSQFSDFSFGNHNGESVPL